MVVSSDKANLKDKLNDTTRRKHRRARRSPNKSSVASSSRTMSTSSSSASKELDINSIRWPSRREDCAWMSGKVAISKRGGRRGTASSGASRSYKDTLSSASSIGSVNTPSKPWIAKHLGTQGSRRMSTATSTSPSSAISESTLVPTRVRQPLDSITNAQSSSAGASSSPNRPTCTIPATWRRALSNLVLQAEKERAATIVLQS